MRALSLSIIQGWIHNLMALLGDDGNFSKVEPSWRK
jgi:hypothetical protein